MAMTSPRPKVVCVSGSLPPDSKTERLALWCATALGDLGAEVVLYRGADIEFPHYRMPPAERDKPVQRYLEDLKKADGVVLISPTYHGTVSGVLKNALDYVNDLIGEPRPFLDGRPVGCVAVAAGDQGATATLTTLRTIAHALRAWPTPLGVAATGPSAALDAEGGPADDRLAAQLQIMFGQVLTLAVPHARRRSRGVSSSTT
ncbi:NADPH-dependent FMN reductase [Streptomyces buecherae]|uniref:NADPH-dependent FMN reductase n=1 Tax=Streptomyces buecherae TaxID=2763006 RepID=UPI001E63EB35|nr:NAD(P)H-dependent oxidoreductase [Streptomyces buecherae]